MHESGRVFISCRKNIGLPHLLSASLWIYKVDYHRVLQIHFQWHYSQRNASCLYPSHTGQTDTKPISNRQKSSNSGKDRFTVGIDSVLSVWCRFMFGQTNLSGSDLSNMFERSLPDKLSVVCRLYVGVVSVLSGSVRGRVGLNSATDGRWFVGLRSVVYRAYVGRPDTDSRPIQVRHNTELRGVGRHIPESKPTSARHISNSNRM